ncbi:hypothetical protein AVEN_141237-1 [Araneus ventricosus]|uniref:Uncharacterized protein n=1 Tax=Araneus ventricosus TaxID=182803 RepID=A0A4Y2S917_ARAVE|nr:hypothetical protein AVEN_141237-1 [Araneus ventricosus]
MEYEGLLESCQWCKLRREKEEWCYTAGREDQMAGQWIIENQRKTLTVSAVNLNGCTNADLANIPFVYDQPTEKDTLLEDCIWTDFQQGAYQITRFSFMCIKTCLDMILLSTDAGCWLFGRRWVGCGDLIAWLIR